MLFGLRNATRSRNSVHGSPRVNHGGTRGHANVSRRAIPVGEQIPNWRLLNNRNTHVPLYGELPPDRPTVIVVNPITSIPTEWRKSLAQEAWGKRLQAYEEARLNFQRAKVSVFFICPQTHKSFPYNIPIMMNQGLRIALPIYSLTQETFDELKAQGYPFEQRNGLLYGKPSTIILTEDKKIAGFSENETAAPEDEALYTLEYMFKTKLAVKEDQTKKFGMY